MPTMPTAADLLPLLPVLVLTGVAFLVLMLDLVMPAPRRVWLHGLSVLGLIVVAWMSAAGTGGGGTVLNGMFVRDAASDLLMATTAGISALALLYAWPGLRAENLYRGEVPALVLFATTGMLLLVSAGSLVMVYLGLELLALCQYALVALDRDNPRSTEAGMKYFVLGSLASGLLLYGLSLLYGATGSLDIARIAEVIQSGATPMLMAGMVFVLAGIAFKFGAAPFHMWLPDVYQGAPTAITLFIGSAPKLAAVGMAWRLLGDALGGLAVEWQWLLAWLAVLSLAVGNLLALMQGNLKRMLAYSTISHVGFLFIGMAGGGGEGFAAAGFYALAYALMSAAAFGAIIVLSRKGFEAERLDDLKGLNTRDPWLAGMVLCVMASLAGVPPFLGFWAKLVVLRAALHGQLLWLAIVGVVFAVIGAFYYLRVIKLMYFDAADGDAPAPSAGRGLRLVFGVNALGLLALGIVWNPLFAWCVGAFG
jgi:NADH-quinone oxidoreductase subunit N